MSVVEFHALKVAQSVEFELHAVGKFKFEARGLFLDFYHRLILVVGIEIPAYGFDDKRFRHGFGLAVDRRPRPAVAELYFRAVGQPHVVVGLLEKMLVNLYHSHLCFGKVFGEEFLSLFGQVFAVEGIYIPGARRKSRGGKYGYYEGARDASEFQSHGCSMFNWLEIWLVPLR